MVKMTRTSTNGLLLAVVVLVICVAFPKAYSWLRLQQYEALLRETVSVSDRRYVFGEEEYGEIVGMLAESYETIRLEYDEFVEFTKKTASADNNFGKDFAVKYPTLELETFGLLVWKRKVLEMCNEVFIETCALLLRDERILNAGFSILRANTKVNEHRGFLPSVTRVHLGIVVPPGCCQLHVGNETLAWQEASVIAFDDTITHYVENTSDQDRVILLIDVIKNEFVGFSDQVIQHGSIVSGFDMCPYFHEKEFNYASYRYCLYEQYL